MIGAGMSVLPLTVGIRSVLWRIFLVAGLLLVSVGAIAQDVPVPALNTWVTDTTGTLDASTRSALHDRLAALDREKGAQIAVLMVPTTGNESIEAYASRAFEAWRLGRKGVDDGILLVVAKDDRRLRIEVGYGLEGAVPDVLAGRIIREQIAPRFSDGQFAQGVVAGVNSLIGLVEGEDLPPPARGASGTAGIDDAPWFLFPALMFMALLMPIGLPTLFLGVFAGIAFGSVSVGIFTAIAAAVVGILARIIGVGNTRQTVAASRRGSGSLSRSGRYGGGFGGGGMGGGGGGAGGGGGGSGGGGASGGW